MVLSANISLFSRIRLISPLEAFDTVWHATLMSKIAQLDIPDSIYNWINYFLLEHSHCTKYASDCFTVAEVKAMVGRQSSGVHRHGSRPIHQIITGKFIFK
jgi:hypothetical protein